VGPWTLLRELSHPASWLAGKPLVPSSPGRGQQRAGRGRSSIEPPAPAKAPEVEHFARTLAEILRDGLAEDEFSSLVVVAPLRLLESLREQMGARIARRLVATRDEDMSALPQCELEAALARPVVATTTGERG
jgi:protein required for attachment to host cells